MTAGIAAAGALLQYIQETQKTDLSHIEKITHFGLKDILIIDDSSRRNLELIQTIIGSRREGSLLATLDFTKTPMGARFLKKNLLFPLQDHNAINKRLHGVEQLYSAQALCKGLQDMLAKVYDLERLNSRIVLGHGNARDLSALKLSLAQLPQLKNILKNTEGVLIDIHDNLDEMDDVFQLLDESIKEDAPVTLREGNLIRNGYNRELDEYISILKDGKSLILGLEKSERGRSGINNLKIGFNKIFGYYFEVSKGQLEKVPAYFIRKQTLVNAERYITPELKEFEDKVLGAEEKRLALEYTLFCKIRSHIASQGSRILHVAALIARLDFYACLATVAMKNHYIKPEINDGEAIIIREGRHPVIEQAMPPGRFVPNDIHLDQSNEQILIITGPNMAGKSTVLRQTALIVLMAQMGSFVPAAEAKIGVVDRIFTRVGAMDNLRRAQSTFMVEMNETANILNNATEKSLVILDEIGRGTSTFDGLSIAWSVTEDLANKNGKGVKTIFATHYHELTDLALTFDRIKNYNIAVREWNDSIVFLHKLLPGGTNRSYGIQVAALAGVPKRVVERAKELLHNIEKGELTRQGKPRIALKENARGQDPSQLELFAGADDPLRKKLDGLQLDNMTPLDALKILYELKSLSYAE
jgi:DNA mismatch repair protein MutS